MNENAKRMVEAAMKDIEQCALACRSAAVHCGNKDTSVGALGYAVSERQRESGLWKARWAAYEHASQVMQEVCYALQHETQTT